MQEITKLLSHYWLASENEALRRAQLDDWLADFKEFSVSVVASSCAAWRRSETRRPMIADLRKLCFELAPPTFYTPMPRLIPPPPDPDFVREGWKKIPFPDLTRAEQKLFRNSFGIIPYAEENR